MINPIIIIIIIIEGPMVCTTIVLGIMTGKVSRYINIYKYKYMNTNINIYKQNIRINLQLSDLACRHHPFSFLTLSWQSLILIIFSSIMTIRISLILALIFFCIIMAITFWAFLQTSFAEEGNLIEPEVDPRHDPPVQDLMYQVIVDVDDHDHDYNDPHCV